MNNYQKLRALKREINQLKQITKFKEKNYDKLLSETRTAKVGNAYTLDAHCDIIELQGQEN